MGEQYFKIPAGNLDKSSLTKAKTEINSSGGLFVGDGNSGFFEISTPIGEIHGNYTVLDNVMSVCIYKKPMLISYSFIEKKMRQSLGL